MKILRRKYKCKICGDEYRVETHIPDEVYLEFGGYIICNKCRDNFKILNNMSMKLWNKTFKGD